MGEIERDFDFDVTQEDIILSAVRDTFIEPFLKEKLGIDYKILRYEEGEAEKLLQLKGIDIYAVNKQGKIFNIDCKAQTNGYIGVKGVGPTPTFCCELDYLKDGSRRKGWLLDDLKDTTHLMFIWIDDAKVAEVNRNTYRSNNESGKMIENKEDIYAYRVMIVKIENLWLWLNHCGCTKDVLEQAANFMRENNIYRLHYDLKRMCLVSEKPEHNNWVSIVKTSRKSKEEEPINIVIKISQWCRIASCYCGVDEDGIHVKVYNGKFVKDKNEKQYKYKNKF